MQKRVTVLGSGAFGTAFSTLLSENGFSVNLWCYEEDVSSTIRDTRMNTRFLPGVHLHENISSTASLREALEEEEWIFIAVPVKFLRSVLTMASPHVNKDQKWVVLSKGIEQDTFLLPGGIIDDVLGYEARKCVVAGPNFAAELAKKLLSGAALASKDAALGAELLEMLANPYFKPYLSDDPIGVQVCSAIKNVLALMVGIARGYGFKDNTSALILTLGLAETGTLIGYFGGKSETAYGFSGVGDLVLSCMGALGRNLKVGTMIGEGRSLGEIEEETGIVAEGVNTVKSVQKIMIKGGLNLPICMGCYKVMFEGRDFKNILTELFSVG